jgi:hypothetical protein
MKPRAIDQTRLKGLKLLTGNYMIVNIDDHEEFLSVMIGSYLSETRDLRQDERRLE